MHDDYSSPLADTVSATELANRLVWYGSQLQRWGAARTPRHNEYEISFSQVSLLYLVRYGITTPGAIAKIMMITPRAVTTHVDVLVDKGLLTRHADAQDRRLVRLSVTTTGDRLSREIEQTSLLPLVEIIEHLPCSDQAILKQATKLLADITATLRTHPPK